MEQHNLIDGDAFLDALEPPRYQQGGVRYTGRHLSLVEYLRAMRFVEARQLAIAKADLVAAEKTTRYLVEMIFPSPVGAAERRTLWRRIVAWLTGEERKAARAVNAVEQKAASVADLVSALPWAAQEQVLTGFLKALSDALRGAAGNGTKPPAGSTELPTLTS